MNIDRELQDIQDRNQNALTREAKNDLPDGIAEALQDESRLVNIVTSIFYYIEEDAKPQGSTDEFGQGVDMGRTIVANRVRSIIEGGLFKNSFTSFTEDQVLAACDAFFGGTSGETVATKMRRAPQAAKES